MLVPLRPELQRPVAALKPRRAPPLHPADSLLPLPPPPPPVSSSFPHPPAPAKLPHALDRLPADAKFPPPHPRVPWLLVPPRPCAPRRPPSAHPLRPSFESRSLAPLPRSRSR